MSGEAALRASGRRVDGLERSKRCESLKTYSIVRRLPSRLWIKFRPDRTRRSRVRSTRENRRFSKWKKVMDDFFHGQLAAVPSAAHRHCTDVRGRRGLRLGRHAIRVDHPPCPQPPVQVRDRCQTLVASPKWGTKTSPSRCQSTARSASSGGSETGEALVDSFGHSFR